MNQTTRMSLRSNKTDTKTRSNVKSSTPDKLKQSLRPTAVNLHNTSTISSPRSIKSLADEIDIIKQIVENQCKSNELLIKKIRAEANSKFEDIHNQILSLRNEIVHFDDETNAVCKSMVPTAGASNFNQWNKIRGSNVFECLYPAVQAIYQEIDLRIKTLHENDKKIEDTLADMIHVISSVHYGTLNEGTEIHDNHDDDIESLTNAIQCMQKQLNETEILTIKNAEKHMKMNQQMHVLSAKFIDFNVRVNNFVFDFNVKTSDKFKINEVIDRDARKFFVKEKTSKNNTVTTESFSSSSSSVDACTKNQRNGQKSHISHTRKQDNRFSHTIDAIAYTKHIRVILRDTSMGDLDVFVNDFKQQFEASIGSYCEFQHATQQQIYK